MNTMSSMWAVVIDVSHYKTANQCKFESHVKYVNHLSDATQQILVSQKVFETHMVHANHDRIETQSALCEPLYCVPRLYMRTT